ncbi:hypothetical protein B0H11DRAFT_2243655 [Mycena galericulata]|nr:hypothetical protein B0H11DRAFT_2243655 [Mycena galericulata]
MHALRPAAVATTTSPILSATARRAYCTHARPHNIVSVCAPHAVPPSPPPRCPLSTHEPQSASPLARILLLCERIRLGSPACTVRHDRDTVEPRTGCAAHSTALHGQDAGAIGAQVAVSTYQRRFVRVGIDGAGFARPSTRMARDESDLPRNYVAACQGGCEMPGAAGVSTMTWLRSERQMVLGTLPAHQLLKNRTQRHHSAYGKTQRMALHPVFDVLARQERAQRAVAGTGTRAK